MKKEIKNLAKISTIAPAMFILAAKIASASESASSNEVMGIGFGQKIIW